MGFQVIGSGLRLLWWVFLDLLLSFLYIWPIPKQDLITGDMH
jgi:hypothetical protein